MQPSERLERIPPYLFAELERKIEQKKAAGIDVISLGIGDPDTPTPGHILRAMAEALHDPSTHRYPTNRGRSEFREAVAEFYLKRFEVSPTPRSKIRARIRPGAATAYHDTFVRFGNSSWCSTSGPRACRSSA